MKTVLVMMISMLFTFSAQSQLISRFTWETNPVTKAVYGPDAISVSSYATVSPGGAKGTNGLNPGAQADINLVLDGAYYNVPALDIRVDFRREEGTASFFYRGSHFNFGMSGGALSVTFLLMNGAGFTTVNSGNIATVKDDHLFHTYRFSYDNNTGVAKVWVDTSVVYAYAGTAGVPLYWTGAGNVTIGKDMDATGKNIAILDNLVIQKYAYAALPVSLKYFTATPKNNAVEINWSTVNESGLNTFVVQRSTDGVCFKDIKSLDARNSNAVNYYQFTDTAANAPTCHYRLKILNTDGTIALSEIKTAQVAAEVVANFSAYPNPATNYILVKTNHNKAGKFRCTLLSMTGQLLLSVNKTIDAGTQLWKIDLTNIQAKGMIVLQLVNTDTGVQQSVTFVKK